MVNSKLAAIAGFSILVVIILGSSIVFVIFNNPIKEMDDLGVAADFTLPSIDGSNYTMSSDTGKVRVLTFVYTECSKGCAVIVSKMNSVLRDLVEKESNKQVKFITIDFDYKYDNISDLAYFAAAFNNNTSQWQWLLGNKNQTDKVTNDYGFYFEENSTSSLGLTHGENHSVVYSQSFMVYLIDPQGHLRGELSGITWKNSELYNRIEFLLDEK